MGSFGEPCETQTFCVFFNCGLLIGTQDLSKTGNPERWINGLQVTGQTVCRLTSSSESCTCRADAERWMCVRICP